MYIDIYWGLQDLMVVRFIFTSAVNAYHCKFESCPRWSLWFNFMW